MREMEKVERFHEELLNLNKEGMLVRVVTYIFLVIFMGFMFVPAQELLKDNELRGILILAGGMFAMGVAYYVAPYRVVVIDRMREVVADKLLYMPIDRKAYRKFLFKILLGFLRKLLIIGLIFQIGVALIAYREITVWNVLYPLLLTFLFPLLLNLPMIMLK